METKWLLPTIFVILACCCSQDKKVSFERGNIKLDSLSMDDLEKRLRAFARSKKLQLVKHNQSNISDKIDILVTFKMYGSNKATHFYTTMTDDGEYFMYECFFYEGMNLDLIETNCDKFKDLFINGN